MMDVTNMKWKKHCFSLFILVLFVINQNLIILQQKNSVVTNNRIIDKTKTAFNRISILANLTIKSSYSLFLGQSIFYGSKSSPISNQLPKINSSSTNPNDLGEIILPNFDVKTYQSMNPISIKNDSAFGPSGYNFPGTGALDDPYIITGYNITDSTTNLIDIQNTTSHFIIRESWLDGVAGAVGNNGIFFENVTNGVIRNNTIHSCWFGMWIESSNDTTILENNIYNNSASGITLRMSTIDTTVSRNKIYFSSNNAIYVYYANFTILSNNDLFNNSGSGIEIQESHYNYVFGNNISYNYGNFLYSSDNNTIINNTVVGNSYTGILADSGADDNIVKNNNFFGNNNSGIQGWDDGSNNNFTYNYWDDHSGTDSNGDGIFDVVYSLVGAASNTDPYPLVYPYYGYIIRDTIFINDNADFVALGFPGAGTINNPYLIEGYNITDSTTNLILIQNTDVYFVIRDNLLDGITASQEGIVLTNARNGIVERNIIHSTVRAILLQGSPCYNNILSNNIIYNISLYGIYISSSHDNIISRNTVYNCSDYGIKMDGGGNTTIANNIVFNITYSGISIGGYSDNNTLANNTVFNTAKASPNAGIYFDWSDNNTIFNNTIYNNSDSGLIILNSNYNNVTGNTLINNSQYGIWIWVSSNNYISRNVLTDNIQYGIFVDSSSAGNTLELNNFFGNNLGSTQTSDAGSGNTFIYNYWDDHTGPDTTPFDGYVDTPYNIDGGSNTDPSPRVYPFLPHDPIYIDKNADFATLGFSGQGTINDPYLIEDYFIINFTTTLIHIQDTRAYFIIRYNYLHGNATSDIGIYLQNVTSGYIHNNTVQNGTYGINLALSDYNNLSYNSVFNCGYGLYLQTASNNEILNNSFTNNEMGIYMISNSDNNTISENIADSNLRYGMYVYSNSNNNIIYNNTISANGDASTDAGIYIRSYNNSVIGNYVINNNYKGFYLSWADNNTIINNSVYGNGEEGLFLLESKNNTINENIIHDNSNGFTLEGTYLNQIFNNTIYSNGYGIIEFRANNDVIYNNSISNNVFGIWLYYSFTKIICHNITIKLNTFTSNGISAIKMDNVSDSVVQDNEFIHNSGSGYCIELTANSSDNTLSGNVIRNSSDYGIYLDSKTKNNNISLNEFYFNKLGNAQAYDDGLSNSFTYNFWNEWTTPDNNADGIVDNPYALAGTATNFDFSPRVSPNIPHNPIYIDDNADFITLGFPGQGTQSNPYIIENYNILNSTATLIEIHNTTVYFIIRFNGLNAVDKGHTGIALYNITHGTIANNSIQNCNYAIGLSKWSNNNTIENNSIFNNDQSGIYLYNNAYENEICYNTIYNHTSANGIGFSIENCENNTIDHNSIFNMGNHGIWVNNGDRNNFTNNNITYNVGAGVSFYLVNCDYNRLDGNTIVTSIRSGIDLVTSTNNMILNNILYSHAHSGIRIRVNSISNTLTNNTNFLNTWGGILIESGSTNNIIYENNLYNQTGYGIRIESTGNTIENNTISNNTGNGISLVSDWNIIRNNSIFDNTLNGIFADNLAANNNITSNTIFQNNNGILMGSSIFNLIENNTAYMNNYDGIQTSGTNTTILNNTLYENSRYGIFLFYADNITLLDNVVFDHQPATGISISGSHNATIINNQVYSCGYGIALSYSLDNIIKDNIISNNNGRGFSLFHSNYTILENNVVYNTSGEQGIQLDTAYNNIIRNNEISDCYDYGIEIISFSSDNLIEWNIFIDNYWGTSQANDDGANNNFQYNYWNDHTSPDLNADGYVDNAYAIDGTATNTDDYPRVYPYVTHNPIHIDEDADFDTLNFSGQGTINDPYRIEYYFIKNSTTTLIHIQDTNVYFIIRNNSLNGVNGSNYGIYLDNVTNGVIINNDIHSGFRGIFIDTSLNVNITGNSIFNQSNQGMFLFQSYTVNISQNDIYNITGNGIYLSSTNGSIVSENTIRNNSQNGITLFSTYNNKIFKNYVFNNSQYGIFIDSSIEINTSSNIVYNNLVGIYLSSSSNDNTIINNTIFNNSDNGLHLSQSDSNYVFNNSISGNMDGINVISSKHNILNRNNVSSNGAYGIRIATSSFNITVNGNIINDHTRGVYLLDSNNCSISNNTIYDSLRAIQLIGSSNQSIFDNVIFDNSYGVFLTSNSSYNTVSYNNIYDHSTNGIQLSNSHNNEFYSNTITNNSDFGIRLDSNSDNNSFVKNIISIHMNGIYLLSSNNTVITGNKITNNTDIGIYFESVSNNSIVEWNVFVNTGGSHAIDSGANNQFQFNYWDNHTGLDNNFDGIVDAPYFFTGGNDPSSLIYPYTKCDPIFIDDNTDFAALGFPGDGSLSNPYLIEGYYINNSTANLVYIQDTTAYFIIRNNFLNSSTKSFIGIYLSNLLHGSIVDNIIHSAYIGIFLNSSVNNILSGNTIYNNLIQSIFLYYSDNNIISNNNVFNNSGIGINVSNSDSNVLSHNTASNNTAFGIVIFEAIDNNVFNNTIYNNTFDGIILTNTTTGTTLVNNTVFNNSRYGIMVTYSSTDNNISYNDVFGNLGTGIVLYLDCTNNILSNNTIYNNFNSGIGAVNSSSNNILSNNHIFNNSWNGIGLINSSNNNNISFNEIHHNLWNGIFMNASSNHNTLSDNTLYNNSYTGILLESAAFNNTIVSNSIYNNSLAGISTDSAHNNTLLSNDIQDQQMYGIYLYNSNYTTIISNNVSDNEATSIYLVYSNTNTIINNSFSNSTMVGVYLLYSHYNLLISNLISFNSNITNLITGFGVIVAGSVNNTLSNNTMSDNANQGIIMGPDSSNNTIKWNDFLNNNLINTSGFGSSQAYDNGSSNLFLNNFWSDWTTPDINPIDGIVDNPYTINGSTGNSDPLPRAITAIHDLSIPTVRYPNDSGVFGGVIVLLWDPAIDSWNHSVTYTLFYSSDGGSTWTLIDSNWTNTNYTWDTTSPLALNGTNFLIHINATCSTGLRQMDTSDIVFTINNDIVDTTAPEIIFSLFNHSYVELTVGHNLTWIATDQFPDTYTIWMNNTPIPKYTDVDWFNNTPITINIDNLSPGLYIYKIEFSDSSDNTSTHEVWVTVTENALPIVEVTYPNGGEIIEGLIRIEWTANDTEGESLTFFVSYWNGYSWISLANNISETDYIWDTTTVIDRSDYKIRVNASDGYLVGVDESNDTFTIDNDPTFQQVPSGYTEFTFEENYIIGIDVSGTVNITITTEVSNPPETPENLEPLDIYFNITLSDPNEIIDLWINISFSELGEYSPENVRIYYYYEADGQWLPVKESGVDYINEVVWGWTDHLTLFGVMDVHVQTPDNLIPVLIMTGLILTPVIIVSLLFYRRTRRRLRLKKVKKEVRKAQIDLGLLTKDIKED